MGFHTPSGGQKPDRHCPAPPQRSILRHPPVCGYRFILGKGSPAVNDSVAASLQLAVQKTQRRRSNGKLKTCRHTPRLSVVIVNYYQWESTAALVRQILRTRTCRQGGIEVVIVDNHSDRHPLAARMRRWRGVSVRKCRRNHGFARAVNEGCRLSRGKWVLLLNPDLTLTKGFLDGVLALADKLSGGEDRTGIVGFQLLNSDGTTQLSSGHFPTLPTTLAGLLQPRWRRKYQSRDMTRRCGVPWVTGCCQLLRRECLEEVGGFDESFFLYYEDVDICQRAGPGLVGVLRATAACVSSSSDPRPAGASGVRSITRHALLTYAKQHWPSWQYGLLTNIVKIEASAAACGALSRRRPSGGRVCGNRQVGTGPPRWPCCRGPAKVTKDHRHRRAGGEGVGLLIGNGILHRHPKLAACRPAGTLFGQHSPSRPGCDRSHRGRRCFSRRPHIQSSPAL